MSSGVDTPLEQMLADASQLAPEASTRMISMVEPGVYPSRYPLPGSIRPPLARLDPLPQTLTSVHSSSSVGSLLPPADNQPANTSHQSSSRSTTRSRKRKRSEDNDENSPRKVRRSMEGGEDGVKKRKAPEGEQFICRICEMIDMPSDSFSRKDSLKRHIARQHEVFSKILMHDDYDILKPRKIGAEEDITELVMICRPIQLEAQSRGIESQWDLALLYPEI